MNIQSTKCNLLLFSCVSPLSSQTCPWPSYSSSQLNVLLHDGHSFRMYRAQVAACQSPLFASCRDARSPQSKCETTYASSNKCTRNASAASCNANKALDCHRRFPNDLEPMSSATSRTCHQRRPATLLRKRLGTRSRTHHSAERQFSNQKIGRLLIFANLLQRNCARSKAMRFSRPCYRLIESA